MKIRAQLSEPPAVDPQLGVVWIPVNIQPDGEDEEIVVQSRPHDGRSYRAGSEHLNDVLVAAVASHLRDDDRRFGTPRSRQVLQQDDLERVEAGTAQVLEVESEEFDF